MKFPNAGKWNYWIADSKATICLNLGEKEVRKAVLFISRAEDANILNFIES